jgi:hypothetical protein
LTSNPAWIFACPSTGARYSCASISFTHSSSCTPASFIYLLIPYLSKRLNWKLEQLLWFCFINGNTQHPPTSWLIFKRFPDFAGLDTASLIDFFNSEWARLEFDTDRRHQKRDFPKAVKCYKALCGDSQQGYFAGFINSSDEKQNFRNAWATVRRDFYGFGRLSAFS